MKFIQKVDDDVGGCDLSSCKSEWYISCDFNLVR